MSKQNAPSDLQEHLARLTERGLVTVIGKPINKDTELHPLARWQFQGGLRDEERRAFLFTNVVGAKDEKYDIPVLVGGLAASPEIYAAGLGVPVGDIGKVWVKAMAEPVQPVLVNDGPCQQIVETGDDLKRSGLASLPVPISTPGFDSAPYLTATLCVTKDPDSSIQNMGTYRAALKANDRLGVRMASRLSGAGGYLHWQKYKKLKREMPCAIVVGCAPAVLFTGPQKLAIDVDEMAVAGGLMGAPVRTVRCKTVDLVVPADSEIVIEGLIDTDLLEPEGPFGESHGHVALEEFNMPMRVTAITHRRNPIIPSYISQVAPSESSVIKRIAYEPLFTSHLRNALGIRGVKKVALHEPLTGLLRVTVITLEKGTPRTEVWRALQGAAFFKGDCGKICIAVNEDIDVDNADALLWAMAYRMNPVEDVQLVPHRGQGHGPKREHTQEEDSTLLMDATIKSDMPPLALPTKDYMERAKAIWQELGFEPLRPQAPWFGYSLGDWLPQWDEAALRAATGRYLENGRVSEKAKRKGLKPETKYRPGEYR